LKKLRCKGIFEIVLSLSITGQTVSYRRKLSFMTSPARKFAHPGAVVALGGILLLAFFARIWGVDFGLPAIYHPDEERLVHHALAFGLGDLNPHYFNYPSLAMYLLFAQYAGFYALGRLFGIFSGVGDFQSLFFSDPSAFYLIGRGTSAFLGAVTVYLIYRWGRRAYGRVAGLVAALLLGISFLHVRSSHFICTDILLTLFVVWTYFQIMGILGKGDLKYYAWAGLLAGLGAGAKYNAATLAVPIILAHFLTPSQKGNWVARFFSAKLLVCGGMMLGAFLLTSPYIVLDFSKFLKDFIGISTHMQIGVYSTAGESQWMAYFPEFLFNGVYYRPVRLDPVGFLLVAGFVWAVLRHRKQEIVIASYPILYFLMISSWGVANARYLIPVFPGLIVLTGGAFQELYCQSRNRVPRIVLVGGLLAICSVPAYNIVLHDIMLDRVDTRTLAKQWIERHIPEGTGIALEWDNNSTVVLVESDEIIKDKIEGYERGELHTIHHPAGQMIEIHQARLRVDRGPKYRIVRLGEVDGLKLIPANYDLEQLYRLGVEYIVLSHEVYQWIESPKGRSLYPVHAGFYDRIFSEGKPLIIFRGDNRHPRLPGPEIRVYRLGDILLPGFSQSETQKKLD